jgi:hypothetical protein
MGAQRRFERFVLRIGNFTLQANDRARREQHFRFACCAYEKRCDAENSRLHIPSSAARLFRASTGLRSRVRIAR